MTAKWPDMTMVATSAQVMEEAGDLSGEILTDIELSRVKLSVVVLKAVRLSRLLNDFEFQQIFQRESSGYPTGKDGIEPDVWELGSKAGRTFYHSGKQDEEPKILMFRESIERLEQTIELGTTSIQAAHDPNVSISSANQYQRVGAPQGNARERRSIRNNVLDASGKLSSRRTFIYEYAARKHHELKFSAVANDVFSQLRASVDASIGSVVPNSVKTFTAIYNNLDSRNPEDWANAAHGCRRVLQDLADILFPPQLEPRNRTVSGKEVRFQLGPEHYINRLMAYVEDSSQSDRFTELVGSHLRFMSDRLHAVFGSANKGSHAAVSKPEANRCVIYTYMLVGDILSLREPPLADIRRDADRRDADDDVMPSLDMDSDGELPERQMSITTIP